MNSSVTPNADRPIFVVGYARSGTTLLQSLLGAHPRIAAPPELHFLLRLVELADHWGDLADDDRATIAVHEALAAPFGFLDNAGFDEDEVRAEFFTTDRSYAALLDTVMTNFARRHRKPRWSEKTPQQRPAQIWSLLPDAQVLHIVRDPREVAASEARTFRLTPAWRSAQRCRHFTERSIADAAARPRDAYLRLRYEDLAADPEPTLREVCDFLGEDFWPDWLTTTRAGSAAIPGATTPWQSEAAEPIRPATSSWQNALGLRQRALVAAIVADQLDHLGYPASPRNLVRLGRALLPTTWPAAQRERAQRARLLRSADTPAARHAALQDYISGRAPR